MTRSGRTLGLALTSFVLLLGVSSGLRAQEALEEARTAFAAGEAAFGAGRFDEAARHFERCFEITQEPDVLYNVAATYERMGRLEDAMASYRRYLELRPDTSDRAQIQSRIDAIASELAARAAAEPEPEPAAAALPPVVSEPEPPRIAPPPREPNTAAWVLSGVGAGLSIVGAILLGVAQADIDQVANGTMWAEIQGPYERVPYLVAFGGAGLGVGLAGLAGGGVWLVVEESL
jgi:tetratricopeptide (TPR) repeat protein